MSVTLASLMALQTAADNAARKAAQTAKDAANLTKRAATQKIEAQQAQEAFDAARVELEETLAENQEVSAGPKPSAKPGK